MKNLILFALVSLLCACQVGKFEENRERMHSMGNDICQTNPDRCINGIPW